MKNTDIVTLGLGDLGYEPTPEEVKTTIEKAKQSWAKFKEAIYFIYIHKMYMEAPYNYQILGQFIEQEFTLTRASFYRIINEIEINYLLLGSYEYQSPKINSFKAQKLSKFIRIAGCKKVLTLWHFLNCVQEENITGKLIDKYIAMYFKKNALIPFKEYDGSQREFIHQATPRAFAIFESKYLADLESEVEIDYDIEAQVGEWLEEDGSDEDSSEEDSSEDDGSEDDGSEDDGSEDDGSEDDGSEEDDSSDIDVVCDNLTSSGIMTTKSLVEYQDSELIELHKYYFKNVDIGQKVDDGFSQETGMNVYFKNIGNHYSLRLLNVLDAIQKLEPIEISELQNFVDVICADQKIIYRE